MVVAATSAPKGLGPQNPTKKFAQVWVLLDHLLSQNLSDPLSIYSLGIYYIGIWVCFPQNLNFNIFSKFLLHRVACHPKKNRAFLVTPSTEGRSRATPIFNFSAKIKVFFFSKIF